MAGFMQMHSPQRDGRAVGNVDTATADARVEQAFERQGHTRTGLPRPNDSDAIKFGQPVAALVHPQHFAVGLHMCLNRLGWVRRSERRAKYCKRVFAAHGRNNGRARMRATTSAGSRSSISMR